MMKSKSTKYITLAICCILMFTGCGNKENAGNGIDMVTDGKLFRYKEFAFGDELSDIKENKELRSETDYHIVLKDDVTIFGISGGVVEIYSSPETNDCVTSVVVNYIYSDENAEKNSQATFDTLFDNLQKQVPSDCTTLDRRTGGNGALYISDYDNPTSTHIAPAYVWIDSEGNRLVLSQSVYRPDSAEVKIEISDKDHYLVADSIKELLLFSADN